MQGGTCHLPLCCILEDEFTTCCFKWMSYYKDLTPVILRGKRVHMSNKGDVTFHHVVVKEHNLNRNWGHLRNMAKRIVHVILWESWQWMVAFQAFINI